MGKIWESWKVLEAKRSGLKFSAGTLSSEVRGSREQHTVTISKASGATYYYEGVGGHFTSWLAKCQPRASGTPDNAWRISDWSHLTIVLQLKNYSFKKESLKSALMGDGIESNLRSDSTSMPCSRSWSLDRGLVVIGWLNTLRYWNSKHFSCYFVGTTSFWGTFFNSCKISSSLHPNYVAGVYYSIIYVHSSHI